MTIIQPINESKQQQVIVEVQRYIDMASIVYKKSFEPVEVVFNIKGRAAGIYRYYYKKQKNRKVNYIAYSFQRWFPQKYRQIRFNPWLFAKYPEDSWKNTIPHEVAHYISDCRYGLQNIKPHGAEWRTIMRDFSAEPIVRGDYSLDGIPVRRTRRYDYYCGCRQVELTSTRHGKVQRGEQTYRCRDCCEILMFDGSEK